MQLSFVSFSSRWYTIFIACLLFFAISFSVMTPCSQASGDEKENNEVTSPEMKPEQVERACVALHGHLLKRSEDARLQLLKAQGAVTSLSYSASGSHMLSGTDEGVIQIWNEKGEEVFRKSRMGQEGTNCSFDDKSERFLCTAKDWLSIFRISNNRIIYVCDVEGNILNTKKVAALKSLDFKDGNVFISTETGRFTSWNPTTNEEKELAHLSDGTEFVKGPHESYACGKKDLTAFPYMKKIELYEGGTHKKTLNRGNTGIQMFEFSPDGKMMVSGDRFGGCMTLWNIDKGSRMTLDKFKGLSESVRLSVGTRVSSIAFSPDSQTVASGHQGFYFQKRFGEATLWDTKTGEEVCSIQTDSPHTVNCITYHPKGTHVAIGSDNGDITRWDIRLAEEDKEVMDAFSNSKRTASQSFLLQTLHSYKDSSDLTSRESKLKETYGNHPLCNITQTFHQLNPTLKEALKGCFRIITKL